MDSTASPNAFMKSQEADEGTHLLLDTARPPPQPSAASLSDGGRRRRDNARDVLLSSALSRLGSRSWEFASPLLLLEWSPGSLTAPAVFGLANAAFCTAFGPSLGRRADGWDRMGTVLLGAGMQAMGCLVSIGALVLWNRAQAASSEHFGSDGDDDRARLVSLSIVVFAGVLEALGAGLANTAVKKEWVPICFEEESAERQGGGATDPDDAKSTSILGRLLMPKRLTLSFMNTSMTNIDLCAAMFGPVLAGWVLQLLAGGGESSSAQRGFVAIAGLNVLSFVPEALLLGRVYGSCAALRRREGRRGVGDGASSKGRDGDKGAWRLWLSHPSGLQLLSVSIASLYLTVLSPSSGILTVYLVTIGLAPSSIGAFRAVGALSGVVGIGLFSVARHWGDERGESARNEDIAGHATGEFRFATIRSFCCHTFRQSSRSLPQPGRSRSSGG